MACLITSNLATSGCQVRRPEPGYVLSPYVKVTFLSGGTSITVGNKSSPQNNHHAVVKDFEWGYSDGHECKITIIDEKGGSFVQFMTDLIKDYQKVTADAYTMEVEFGWIKADCPTGVAVNKSSKYLFLCDNVECNFSNGCFFFQITGTDISPRIFEGRFDEILGDDKNQLHLTEAITKLMVSSNIPPTVASVQFLMKGAGQNAEPTEIIWSDGTKEGPKANWQSNGRDKLGTVMNWLGLYTTINGKTVIPVFNNEGTSEIIFWEDFRPACGEHRDFVDNCIGTYIVNGGKDSPVLEFNPRIRWNFMSLANMGGNMGDQGIMPFKDQGGKVPGVDGCNTLNRKNNPGAGAEHSIPDNPAVSDIDLQDAQEKIAKAHFQQLKGWRLFTEAIEADLVVLGDPKLGRPIESIMSKNVKIIFINPRYLESGCTWAESSCNEVLTNQAWLVKYINHKISDGKYTTTIGVFLPVPGADFDVGEPLGGPGSDGPVIP